MELQVQGEVRLWLSETPVGVTLCPRFKNENQSGRRFSQVRLLVLLTSSNGVRAGRNGLPALIFLSEAVTGEPSNR